MLTFIANCCQILLEMLTVNMTNIDKMHCINTAKWRIDTINHNTSLSLRWQF